MYLSFPLIWPKFWARIICFFFVFFAPSRTVAFQKSCAFDPNDAQTNDSHRVHAEERAFSSAGRVFIPKHKHRTTHNENTNKKKVITSLSSHQMQGARQSDVFFGERESGQDVRQSNATAVQAVANIVKSSLGPVGLDKVMSFQFKGKSQRCWHPGSFFFLSLSLSAFALRRSTFGGGFIMPLQNAEEY